MQFSAKILSNDTLTPQLLDVYLVSLKLFLAGIPSREQTAHESRLLRLPAEHTRVQEGHIRLCEGDGEGGSQLNTETRGNNNGGFRRVESTINFGHKFPQMPL